LRGVVGTLYDRTAVLECVPNFSEGRDQAVVDAIADTIAKTPGVLLLGAESDRDHNRSVITFAGSPDTVVEAAVRGAGKAAELIDLSAHQGVHPRVGAADVIPFVPLDGSTMQEAVAAAHRAGEEIWSRFGVPVYFYERQRGAHSGSDWNVSAARSLTARRPISETCRHTPRRAHRWSGRAGS